MSLSDADKRRLADKLLGTCDSVDSAIEFFEIDTDAHAATDGLLDLNVEACKGCGWWHNSYDLENEWEGDVGYCADCAPRADDD